MADEKKIAVSFDDIIKAGRKKKENERLAQEIFGKRRSSTPGNANKKSNPGTSLSSRVGVTKRPASLSRSQSSQARLPQTKTERDPPNRPNQRSSQARGPGSNGQAVPAGRTESTGNGGLSIKGAASGPYIVIASNFAMGTTAADIESVMTSVGGEVTYCRLVASSPTVIAEMGFREKSGADTVISTFNNKKADGYLLYVYMKNGSVPVAAQNTEAQPGPLDAEPEQYNGGDDSMDIDENARSREAENKLREERRGGGGGSGGRDMRDRPDVFPSGPRNARAFATEEDYNYNSNNRGPPQQGYQDARYGFGGGGGYGGRGRYYDDRRAYGGRGGPQWRN